VRFLRVWHHLPSYPRTNGGLADSGYGEEVQI
jgi:hypothetical protein